MVQQLDAGPVRRLHDGTPFLRLNPSRMCRRISSPWSLPEQEVTEHPAWAEAETDALIAAVKSAGHMGWPAVRQHLETSGFVRTDAQCQVQWRQIADPLCRMDGLDKMGPQDGTRLRETGDGNVGERWNLGSLLCCHMGSVLVATIFRKLSMKTKAVA